MITDVGLPVTLARYGGIDENRLEEMAHEMISNYPRPMNPRPMGEEEAVRLWHAMWDGSLGV